jgi:cell division protein FtsL
MVPAAAKSLPKERGRAKQTSPGQKEAVRKPRKRAGLGKRMFGAILITGLLIGSLALRARVIDAGYQLHVLERALAATQTEYDRLSLSIAQLSSLARIEKEAMTSLGMTKPEKTEFIMVASVTNRLNLADDSGTRASEKISRLVAQVSERTEDILMGLISPFVARWFYDIPRCDHPRVRPK